MLPEVLTEIPGPASLRLARELRRYESHNVTCVAGDWPVFWERAEGVNVWDADGNRFLDLTSAFAVAGLGHNPPELVEVVSRQAFQLLHGMGDVHPTALKVELCRQLSAMTYERWGAGAGKVVLSSSGFEAVETALKTAHLATGRREVLAFEGGYHGLGYGALLPGGFGKFRQPFESQLAGELTTFLPYPRTLDELQPLCDRLEQVDAAEVSAVVVEPIQGRGGIVVPPEGFLQLLRDWCDNEGVLLVFDEIFTGFNRSGALFACEHDSVIPDLICLGKAMSGGFPISACVGKTLVMDAWPESRGEALHTSTFLGHPVGCAMALEALKMHQEERTAEAVESLARKLPDRVRAAELAGVVDIRGRGAMWGLQFENEAMPAHLMKEMLQKGYFLLPAGQRGEVLSLTPPFAIAEEEIEACVAALEGACRVGRGYE